MTIDKQSKDIILAGINTSRNHLKSFVTNEKEWQLVKSLEETMKKIQELPVSK